MKTSWKEIKNHIKAEIPKNTFSLWINAITLMEEKENGVILGCPNKFSKNWIMDNYFSLIQDRLQKAGANHVELVVDKRSANQHPPNTHNAIHSNQLVLPNFSTPQRNGSLLLNKEYTFDRFVVGQCNEFAYSASKAIAHETQCNYQTLLMLSNTGLGKTHLSQAIANAILEENPRHRIHYVTAEDFTNDMISALKNNRIEDFKNKYRRSCDVLFLEEIHFLSGKEKIQIELGYTLDALANDNKRIIFTSYFPPMDIPRMSKKLSSRMTAGLVTTINSPDYETRIKILTKKASEQNIRLSKEIIHFLASRLVRDVRQMESALKCLKAKLELLKTKIDVNVVKEVLNYLTATESFVSMEDIENLVCKYYKIDSDILGSKSRKTAHAYPRNIYIYLCRQYTDETVENIAKTINRSHSTVLYASELVAHKIKRDDKMRNQIRFLNQALEDMKN